MCYLNKNNFNIQIYLYIYIYMIKCSHIWYCWENNSITKVWRSNGLEQAAYRKITVIKQTVEHTNNVKQTKVMCSKLIKKNVIGILYKY